MCPQDLNVLTRSLAFRVSEFKISRERSQALGIMCKYQYKNDLFADVFIFKGGVANIPSDISHPLLVQLREQTLSEIVQGAQLRGETARRGTTATIKIETDGGPVSVYYNALIISSPREGARNTFLWLWTARNHVMKIRMTVPPSETSTSISGESSTRLWCDVRRLHHDCTTGTSGSRTPTCVRADASQHEWFACNGVAVHAASRAPLNTALESITHGDLASLDHPGQPLRDWLWQG